MKNREEIEKAICSISTLRILAAMGKQPSKTFSKYALRKETMLNERDVSRAIEKLMEINWIEELNLGRIKLYKLNLKNPKIKTLIEFLKKMNYI